MLLKSNLTFIFDAVNGLIMPGDNLVDDARAKKLLAEETVKSFVEKGLLVEIKSVQELSKEALLAKELNDKLDKQKASDAQFAEPYGPVAKPVSKKKSKAAVSEEEKDAESDALAETEEK